MAIRQYLLKQASADSVCHAIREVQKGNMFFSPSISKRHDRPNPQSSVPLATRHCPVDKEKLTRKN